MGDWQIDSGSGSGGGAQIISTGGGEDLVIEAIFGPETDLEAGS